MNILIIGGTRFLGRHLVAAAHQRNHRITLFNRGLHQGQELSATETIIGDREQDLDKLRGRDWDAVIDTCGFLPRSVQASAVTLAQSVGLYVFISSVSVYADVSMPGVDETALVKTLTNEQLDEANRVNDSNGTSYGQLYGGLKALCEQALFKILPNRTLIIRPGLIVGPYD